MFEFMKGKKDNELFEEDGTAESAEALIEAAEGFNEDENPKKAEKLYQRAFNILNNLYTRQPEVYMPALAACAEGFGKTCEQLEKYDIAFEYFTLASELYEEASQDGSAEAKELLADEYSNIGDTYFFRDKYDDAEGCYLKSLDIYEKLELEFKNKYREDIAYCYDCLAKTFCCKGNYTAAIESYEKVIDTYTAMISEQEESPENTEWVEYSDDLATVYNDIGYTFSCGKDFEDAEKYYLLASEIYEKLAKAFPYEYREQLVSQYEDLATLYADMGDPDREREFEKKADDPGI